MDLDQTRSTVGSDDPGVCDDTSWVVISVTEASEMLKPEGSRQSYTIQGIASFSYNSDVMQVGDPFNVTVPDPRGLYVHGKLQPHSQITLSMVNGRVAGGAATKKRKGLIVRRSVSCAEGGGTVINLECADIGWYLVNCDGPLWFGLMNEKGGKTTFARLCTVMIHPDKAGGHFHGVPDPGWWFRDIVYDNVNVTLLKQGLPPGRAGIAYNLGANMLTPLMRIQIEPGQKLYDVLMDYCRRVIIFVNVTPDGDLVLFLPSYDREPSYQFNCYPRDDSRHVLNNVRAEGIRVMDDGTERWSDVMCVGAVPCPDITDQSVAQDNVNANKFAEPSPFNGRGVDVRGAGLRSSPVQLECIFSDGEALYRNFAKFRAVWKQTMGLFNSHVVTFTVRGLHQDGVWFESDTMCSLDFPVVGVSGAYYITAVRCDRSSGGEHAQITAHKPGLLAVIGENGY